MCVPANRNSPLVKPHQPGLVYDTNAICLCRWYMIVLQKIPMRVSARFRVCTSRTLMHDDDTIVSHPHVFYSRIHTAQPNTRFVNIRKRMHATLTTYEIRT